MPRKDLQHITLNSEVKSQKTNPKSFQTAEGIPLQSFYSEGDLHDNFYFIVELSLNDIFLFLWNLPLIFYALIFLFFYLTWPKGLLKGLLNMFKNL